MEELFKVNKASREVSVFMTGPKARALSIRYDIHKLGLIKKEIGQSAIKFVQNLESTQEFDELTILNLFHIGVSHHFEGKKWTLKDTEQLFEVAIAEHGYSMVTLSQAVIQALMLSIGHYYGIKEDAAVVEENPLA